ncbi:hypothetical protein ACEPPN_012230 [Leptodophora sp. 'Broadleaf-Isolate-01']
MLQRTQSSQLRDINPGDYVRECYARIVSISDTHLRVLDIHYDPSSTLYPVESDPKLAQVSCKILFSVDLCATGNRTERITDEKLQSLDAEWVRAIQITLGIKERKEEVEGG